MARIEEVAPQKAGPVVKLVYGFMRRGTRRMTGRDAYTVAVMRTPVEVSDDLFTRMKVHFSDEQLVELTALLTVVNLDRFNAAFGIGSAGFSEGMVCVPPDRPAVAPDRQSTAETAA